jgi:hypothetical protein
MVPVPAPVHHEECPIHDRDLVESGSRLPRRSLTVRAGAVQHVQEFLAINAC